MEHNEGVKIENVFSNFIDMTVCTANFIVFAILFALSFIADSKNVSVNSVLFIILLTNSLCLINFYLRKQVNFILLNEYLFITSLLGVIYSLYHTIRISENILLYGFAQFLFIINLNFLIVKLPKKFIFYSLMVFAIVLVGTLFKLFLIDPIHFNNSHHYILFLFIVNVLGYYAVKLFKYVDTHFHKLLSKDIEAAKEIESIQQMLADNNNKSSMDYIATVSHELRTPMHSIRAYTRIGIDEISDDSIAREELIEYFQVIKNSITRLTRLVAEKFNMKILEQLSDGNVKVKKVSVQEFFLSTIKEIKSLMIDKDLRLKLETDDNLILECDTAQLTQVIINLMSNTIKYSPKGSTVTIKLERDQINNEGNVIPAIRTSISDQGRGIPEDELKKIFAKYEQSSKTGNTEGTGIGLSVCEEIVRSHKGKIWAENNKEGGATFIFTLPTKCEAN